MRRHCANRRRQALRPFSMTLLIATAALALGAARPETLSPSPPPASPPVFNGDLSVLTYNIHGLPWPVAWNRPAQLARIAAELRMLRDEGRNPHIILFQEAFTQEARSIGRAAGYRYVAFGPAADVPGATLPPGTSSLSPVARSWLKGEDVGKYVGSGLQILSDYPIVGIHRIAYSPSACAGYDCLANKGAMMATVQLPGREEPIDIVTTHLNSRGASRVSNDRSMRAYGLQIASLSAFIHSWHVPSRPLIVAGDFNVGKDKDRRETLLGAADKRWVDANQPVRDIYDMAAQGHIRLSADAAYSFHKAKDWAFYSDGNATDLRLTKIEVPFGHAADGSMLSDHVGYTATFRLSPQTRPVTTLARSKASRYAGEPA